MGTFFYIFAVDIPVGDFGTLDYRLISPPVLVGSHLETYHKVRMGTYALICAVQLLNLCDLSLHCQMSPELVIGINAFPVFSHLRSKTRLGLCAFFTIPGAVLLPWRL